MQGLHGSSGKCYRFGYVLCKARFSERLDPKSTLRLSPLDCAAPYCGSCCILLRLLGYSSSLQYSSHLILSVELLAWRACLGVAQERVGACVGSSAGPASFYKELTVDGSQHACLPLKIAALQPSLQRGQQRAGSCRPQLDGRR